ncbi:S8 family serine peptidase (plasmid) [Streptomyces sp. AHU1]|uniref:S8 family serine peptidase n=1 Tax=Streptomyces sp. AHU1 TaxID=3377215 RepID=UPI003877E6EF
MPEGTHSITLVTGDVVTTRQIPRADGQPGGTVTVRGADGGPAQAQIMQSGRDLYVYPESALPFVASGALDRRLFNITDLVADGYDDAHKDQLPLIVSYTHSAASQRPASAPTGSVRERDLSSIQGAALAEIRAHAGEFWNSVVGHATSTGARAQEATPVLGGGISHIWLDGTVKADLADSTSQIGAPQVWAGGNTGQGVDVAVLDTGIDADHPDLSHQIAAARSFVPDENTDDHYGHGTHVASIIAGTGAASGGKEQGVAPGARLHIGKVLDNTGQGQDSWILAGMEWAAVDQHAKIINLSLGSDNRSDGSDPLSQAVDRLSDQTGALFVVAAGNTGTPNSIGAPGVADAALTVGAVDSTDAVAYFSSQGPRIDGALKPEITAPGVDILAANSHWNDNGEGSYQTLSGTSMATPHVAGAAALLAAAHPDLTGSQLKDLVTSTSQETPDYDAFQGGSGRLSIAAAVPAGVYASATAYAPHVPQTADGAARRPVTYTNTTNTPVTLALSIAATHAPSGVFRLSSSKVVVPAHGSASVTVTIDGSGLTTDGRYSGQVEAHAASGRLVAHTAVSLGYVSYKLTLVLKDPHGRPTSGLVEVLRSGEDAPSFFQVDESGTGEMRLPNDVYSVLSYTTVEGVHGPHSMGMALLGDPDVVLDHDSTVTLDASKATRIDTTTPQRSEASYQRLDYYRSMEGASFRDYMETQTSYDSLWAQPTTHKVTHGNFYLAARWRKEEPALSVSTRTTDFTDVLRQDGVTALTEGERTMPLVFAGQGTSVDYARLNVRGKAVVVRRNDDVPDMQQAANAAAAGAKLMLVVNNQNGRSLRNYGSFSGPVAVDVGLLSTDEGEKLVRQATVPGAQITVDSEPTSPYVYDLMQTHHNAVPSHLLVKGSPSNLARIDVTFDSPDPTRTGGEFRYDWPDYNTWAIGTSTPEPVNEQRTDWVSTGDDYTWGQIAYADGIVYEVDPRTSYRPGSRQSEEWFKPIERPYLNNNYRQPTRSGNHMILDIPGWGSQDHVGMSQDGLDTQEDLALYQGAAQLATGNFTVVEADAPSAKTLPYRLVLTGRRDAAFTPYSTRTRTEWDFMSKAPKDDEAAVLPLLQLDYEIATDADGRARRNSALFVNVGHLAHAEGAGATGAVSLQLSYDDGQTWHAAEGKQGRFSFHAPASASFVSMKATAYDARGNSVTQSVIRAFGLR